MFGRSLQTPQSEATESGEGARAWLIADDLTGALDSSAPCTEAGWHCSLALEGQPSQHADLVIFNTSSRHASAPEAAERVAKLANLAKADGVAAIYKKTDSTLRGNIAAELAALAATFPLSPMVFAPALPRSGRTVHWGELLVDGTPVHQTHFSKDPGSPVRSASIPELLAAHFQDVRSVTVDELRGGALAPPSAGSCTLVDGLEEGDLDLTAEWLATAALPTPMLLAGPGGLSRRLPALFPSANHGKPVCSKFPQRFVAVCGSITPVSREQALQAERAGFVVLDARTVSHQQSSAAAERALRGENLLIHSGLENSIGDDSALEKTVDLAISLVRRMHHPPMLLMGGETAALLLQRLQARELILHAEREPGVAVATALLPYGPVPVITKSGGFGSPDLLVSLTQA